MRILFSSGFPQQRTLVHLKDLMNCMQYYLELHSQSCRDFGLRSELVNYAVLLSKAGILMVQPPVHIRCDGTIQDFPGFLPSALRPDSGLLTLGPFRPRIIRYLITDLRIGNALASVHLIHTQVRTWIWHDIVVFQTLFESERCGSCIGNMTSRKESFPLAQSFTRSWISCSSVHWIPCNSPREREALMNVATLTGISGK
jgi:hypothetical protein